MYIPEFVCGIFATLIAEFVAAAVYSVCRKQDKKK